VTRTRIIILAVASFALGILLSWHPWQKAEPFCGKGCSRVGMTDGAILFPSESRGCIRAPGAWTVTTGERGAVTLRYVFETVCGLPDGTKLYRPGEVIPLPMETPGSCSSLLAHLSADMMKPDLYCTKDAR
jgi:hypothetical protein